MSELTRDELLEALKVFSTGMKHDPASTAFTGGQSHGVLPNGAFGPLTAAGVRPEMVGAMMRPQSVQQILGPPVKSEYANEIVEIMTGARKDGTCTNVSGWCGDPPNVAGNMKVCQQVTPYGKFYGATHLVQIPEIGKLVDRADIGRILLSEPITAHPLVPDILYQLTDTRSALQTVFWEFGQQFELTFERVLARGTKGTSYSQTECGWWTEFDGYDQLVKTGHVDAMSGTACPAADSNVLDWNAGVDATDANSRTLDMAWGDQMYYLETRARQTGNDPVQFVVFMREQVFRQMAMRIACTFATSGCTTLATPNSGDVDRTLYRSEYQGMMQGRYLIANSGTKYQVVFTDGIEISHPSDNVLVTDMFVMPITSRGRRAFWYEYFDMSNTYQSEYVGATGTSRVLNDGMYRYYERDNGACSQISFTTQGRLRLDYPFLAGRINGIRFQLNNQTPNSPYADETYLYVDGGDTYRSSH